MFLLSGELCLSSASGAPAAIGLSADALCQVGHLGNTLEFRIPLQPQLREATRFEMVAW